MIGDTRKIRSIFLEAVEKHPPDEWAAFLDDACAGDEELRQRVEVLLQGHTAHNALLDRPAAELAESGISEALGSVIGPYKLMEQIGEGGMGLVFVAEQQQPVRRKVALKVIKPGMDTRQVVARFEAERQALALMDHPNIARVIDGGSTASGRPFFVMELVKGMPITDFCDQGRLAPRQRIELFIDVCNAVQHAHQRGIIHRDLKPSNVLITSHDGKPVVKVIDFGVAKSIGQQLTDKTLYTQLTQFLGTPLYMSPEQAGQSGLDVDTRTDVYALGVLLYELLTGTTPYEEGRFKAAACDEIRRIIREEDPPRPSTRISTLHTDAATALTASRQSDPTRLSQFLRGELDWIVMKCLEKDRQRRYATANGLAADLQRYLRDENVQACPPSAWYQFRKFAQRNRKPVIASAAAATALLLAVVILSVSNVSIRREQDLTKKALVDVSQARSDLLDVLNREQHNAYFQRIARADLEWWAFNVARADQILEKCQPEHRDWEWRYLKRLCHADLLTLNGHSRDVRAIAISPGGHQLASVGDDQTLKIWPLVSDAPLAAHRSPLNLHGHEQPILGVAFSHDGQRVASVGGDWRAGKVGEAKVWNLADGVELFELRGHPFAVGGVAFSPDGRLIATAGWDGTLRIWDAKTGQELDKQLHGASLKCVAFSPDGKLIACGGSDRVVTIWNVAERRKLAVLRGNGSVILSVAFSPDGKRLIAGCWDHTACLHEISSGRVLHTLRGHRNFVHGVAFSPDGIQVATACGDSSVKLWDSRNGQELRTLRGHHGVVLSAAFTPGGRFLATSGADHTIKLWDLHGEVQSRSFAWPESNKSRLAFHPNGKWIAAANRRLPTRKGPVRVRIYDSMTGEETLALPELADGCFSVDYHPEGRQLVTDWGNQARTWDAQSGREIITLTGHSGQVTATTFGPDGDLVATGSVDKTAKLWNTATGKDLGTLTGHGAALTSLAFRPRQRPGAEVYLATGSKDQSVRIWNVKDQCGVAELFGHRAPVTQVVFSSNGAVLASSSEDGDIRIWDVTGIGAGQESTEVKLLHVLSSRGGVVDSVAFSPDSKRLASTHEDGTVTLWDVGTGQESLSLRRQMTRGFHVLFSPDGKRLVASGSPLGPGGSGVTIWTADDETQRDPAIVQRLLAQDARDGWLLKARAATASSADLAIALFSKAVDLGRDDAATRSERGVQYALKKNWPAAAADFAEAVRHRPGESSLWYWKAAAHLGEKNVAAYEKTRADLLDRFGATSDPAVASRSLYISVVRPSASGEAERLVRLGHVAAPLWPGNERVLAAALYRYGNYPSALKQFDRSARSFEPRAWDWFFRAMAHQQLGNDGRAQECYNAALAWIERTNQAGGRAWLGWPEAIEVECLREEAAALLGRAPGQKK